MSKAKLTLAAGGTATVVPIVIAAAKLAEKGYPSAIRYLETIQRTLQFASPGKGSYGFERAESIDNSHDLLENIFFI